MSKIFDVTLDYLLNEEDSQKPELAPDEKGLYVSREMAEGFLSYQKRKMVKIGVADSLFGEPYEAEFQSGSGVHMYDGNGDEILTDTAGVGWHEKESKAETEVQGGFDARA